MRFRSILEAFELLTASSAMRLIGGYLLGTKLVRIRLRHSPTRRLLHCRPRTADWACVRQVIYDLAAVPQVVSSAETIIDLGAHIGASVLSLADSYPRARLLAIEPSPENFELLLLNSSPISRITAEQRVVWGTSTRVAPNLVDAATDSQSYSQDLDGEATMETVTMVELVQRHELEKVDLLKVDIEGAEESLFLTGDRSWLDIVKFALVEIHDPRIESAILRQMDQYGFSACISGEKVLFSRRS